MSLSGKKALVVGATGGMGNAVAGMLCNNGVNCVVLGRDKNKLNELEQSYSSGEVRFKSIISDISNIDSIRECSGRRVVAERDADPRRLPRADARRPPRAAQVGLFFVGVKVALVIRVDGVKAPLTSSPAPSTRPCSMARSVGRRPVRH